jgi:nitroreductase
MDDEGAVDRLDQLVRPTRGVSISGSPREWNRSDLQKRVMPALNLSADALLSTTRAVRRRLDFDRAVEREVIEDCVRLAQQAPSASNTQAAHFVVVTDPAKKAVLAKLWRRGYRPYAELPISLVKYRYQDPDHAASIPAMDSSAEYLADNLHRAPAIVVPCVTFRTDNGAEVLMQSLVWGAVLPAVWSFCLAARERGLGTCWTTIHLAHEREAAEVLGIPYEEVMQVALLPVAYTKGTDFKAARRLPLERILHWESW